MTSMTVLSPSAATRFGYSLLDTIETYHAKSGVVENGLIIGFFPTEQNSIDRRVIRETASSILATDRKVALLVLDNSQVSPNAEGSASATLEELLENPKAALPDSPFVIIRPAKDLPAAPGSRQFVALTKRLSDEYDFVLLAAPAPIKTDLSVVLALSCHQHYLYVRQESTKRIEVQRTVDKFENQGIQPTGIIYTGRKLIIPGPVYRFLFGR